LTGVEKPQPGGLESLADRINKHHRDVNTAVGRALNHARMAGKLLAEAKAKAGHGRWLPWLEANFEGTERVAQMYMRVAVRWEEIEANTKSVSDLTLSEALKSISAPQTFELTRERVEGGLTWGSRGSDEPAEQSSDRVGPLPSVDEKRAVVEAVAEANDTTFADARRHHADQVSAVRDAVERRAIEREDKGEAFSPEERAAYAKRLAEMKKRTREREQREREGAKKNHGWKFQEVDTRLSKARREVREAIKDVPGVPFDDEERELLSRGSEALRGLLGLFDAALAGDSGTDWDAELFKLEYKRQWGAEEHERMWGEDSGD
jgi:hypothetical protein